MLPMRSPRFGALALLTLAAAPLAAQRPTRAHAAHPTLPTGVTRVGAFYAARRADPVTARLIQTAFTFADDVGPGDRILIFSCTREGAPQAYVVLPHRLAGDGSRHVAALWRFTSDPAPGGEAQWPLIVGRQAAGVPDVALTAFTAAALAAERAGGHFALRLVDPVDMEALEFAFPLAGLARALAPLPCFAAVSAPTAHPTAR